MRALPAAFRPRERLLRHGVAALGETELLALLLGTGTDEGPAEALALDLLAEHACAADPCGLRGLAACDVRELAQRRGLGPAKAARVAAALELGRRATQPWPTARPRIGSPEDAYALLRPRLETRDREVFSALLLDHKHGLIDHIEVAVGTLTATLVHPREVYRAAVRRGAAAVLVAHNHPSGDPTPSPEDRELTTMLRDAGRLIGIRLVDHLVIGHGRWVSIRETTPLWRDELA